MSTDTVGLVALVEDDADLRASIAQVLDLAGYDVRTFAAAEPALPAITAEFAGVVVSDVRMPRMSGIELFHQLRARDAMLPVILMTGHGDVDMAVDALKHGAWDFLTKPFDPDALVAAVGRAASSRSLALENRWLRALVAAPEASPLIGRSPAIARLRDTIAALANAPIDVFVEGETGTGKELVARLLHSSGARARHRFVSVACAALPDALVESELVGDGGGEGRVIAADRGTLLLDDVDRASPLLQARLTQIAEERQVRPAGARAPIPVDVRIVATGGDGAGPGAIDPALFYRLAGVQLRVPPLRERLEDVPLLFAHLLDAAAARLRVPAPPLTAEVRRHLAEHRWPGNVRELAHFADRCLMGLDGSSDTEPSADGTLPERVAAFERRVICDVLTETRGEVARAIEQLGLPRKTFYYKVQRHGIDLARFRRASA
ncbi:sigma-54-dependent transcriptional regulator [Sphingomonas sp. ac-8]|uniref:sigma-54-dependent transcriptional regulator n=1 Tax=Sphingomonas sp. ac-8 TaxID=3242977 RepID=UPI003A8135D1